MTGSVNSKMFDLLLTEAFLRYEEKLNGEIPSDAELSVRYPLPEKEKRSVVKYQKKVAKEKKYGRPMYVVFLRRAVAIVLIAVSVLFGSLLMNEKVRAAVSNAIVQIFEKYVKIIPSFGQGQTGDETDALDIYDFDVLSNIPEEYKVKNVSEDSKMRIFECTKEDRYNLHICIRYSENLELGFDTEYSSFEKFNLGGNDAYIQVYTYEEPYYVCLTVLKNNIVLIVDGYENAEKIKNIAGTIIK